MANTAGYYGFKPIGPQKTAALMEFDIDSSSAAIYRGDLVELVADNGVSLIAAVTNEDNLGVAVGFKNELGVPVAYAPATQTGYKAIVNIDKFQKYMVKGSAAFTAATAIGAVADMTAGTGSTETGLSGAYIAAASNTGTTCWRILGLAPRTGNAWGLNQDLIVILNDQFVVGANGI